MFMLMCRNIAITGMRYKNTSMDLKERIKYFTNSLCQILSRSNQKEDICLDTNVRQKYTETYKYFRQKWETRGLSNRPLKE